MDSTPFFCSSFFNISFEDTSKKGENTVVLPLPPPLEKGRVTPFTLLVSVCVKYIQYDGHFPLIQIQVKDIFLSFYPGEVLNEKTDKVFVKYLTL